MAAGTLKKRADAPGISENRSAAVLENLSIIYVRGKHSEAD